MEQTELKERRYVGVRETLIYGVANGGQVIGCLLYTSPSPRD